MTIRKEHSCPVLPTVVRISLDNPGTVFGISPDNPVTCNTCIYYIGHAVVHVYVLELTKDPLECTSAQAGSFIVQSLVIRLSPLRNNLSSRVRRWRAWYILITCWTWLAISGQFRPLTAAAMAVERYNVCQQLKRLRSDGSQQLKRLRIAIGQLTGHRWKLHHYYRSSYAKMYLRWIMLVRRS